MYREGDKSDETSTDARLTSSSLPVCWGWHPCNKLPSHPKSHDMKLSFISSSFLFKVLCVSSRFWNGAVEDRLFSCIICLLPKRRGSAGRVRPLLHIYGIVFLSSEAIQTVGEQQEVPALRCWTDLLILKRACVYECLFSVTGRMCSAHCCHTKTLAITSSLLSLLDCHDVNDGNSATILRLCSFSLFFCQLGQGVVYPVYVNCCHIKKSHINSKRHNKLIFVKLLDLCNFISTLFLRTNGTCFGTGGRISGSRR